MSSHPSLPVPTEPAPGKEIQLDLRKRHELVAQALHDLKAVKESTKYIVDMSSWFTPAWHDNHKDMTHRDQCCVCLAGSVLCQRFPMDHDSDYVPRDEESPVNDMMTYLDALRMGPWGCSYLFPYPNIDREDAIGTLARRDATLFDNHAEFCPYSKGPGQFIEWLESISDAMAEDGIDFYGEHDDLFKIIYPTQD